MTNALLKSDLTTASNHLHAIAQQVAGILGWHYVKLGIEVKS